ncbi:MAG: DUF2807 domain-containing protein [Marinilabiliaceae bacterium]|nr:DUF2807 domain-containing protein [Marinilabiliaceae bacterium]
MKKTIIFIPLIFCGILLLGQGAEKKEVRPLKSFDKIKISKGINVTLIEGEMPEAEVVIVNAELEDVLIEQKGKEVAIKMKTKLYKDVAVQVYITYQKIREIHAGLGGSLDADDILETDQLVLTAGLDASIELEIEVKKLVVSASAARVEVSGTADYIDVKTSTGGKFFGSELECREASVKTNTGGSASVWVTKLLDATAGSGAKVEYKGNPTKVKYKETLGGRIVELIE